MNDSPDRNPPGCSHGPTSARTSRQCGPESSQPPGEVGPPAPSAALRPHPAGGEERPDVLVLDDDFPPTTLPADPDVRQTPVRDELVSERHANFELLRRLFHGHGLSPFGAELRV